VAEQQRFLAAKRTRFGSAQEGETMKVILLVLGLCLVTSCGTPREELLAIQDAVRSNQLCGVEPDAKIDECSLVWEWPTHYGPYDQLDTVHARMQAGQLKGRQVAFFLGKLAFGTKWEVYAAMVEDKRGYWWPLPVGPGTPVSGKADASPTSAPAEDKKDKKEEVPPPAADHGP
jgi:hypothetical protein